MSEAEQDQPLTAGGIVRTIGLVIVLVPTLMSNASGFVPVIDGLVPPPLAIVGAPGPARKS